MANNANAGLVETGVRVESVSVVLGRRRILEGVDLVVKPGELVALIGHNGAGKTTLLRTIFGLNRPVSGRIRVEAAAEGNGARPARIALVPSERFVFPDLTIKDNLALAGRKIDAAEYDVVLNEIHALFPVLAERAAQLAGTMSGGEQRMLSLGMAEMARPDVLLLDEPSLGLSPRVAEQILNYVRQTVDVKRRAVVLVEQNVHQAALIADRVALMRSGRIEYDDSADDFLAQPSESLWSLF